MTTRDAVPMPPFRSKQLIPVPAPTTPPATAPRSAPARSAIAARTSASSTWTRRDALRWPSSHSATTGSSASSSPAASSSPTRIETAASNTRPIAIELVRKIGDSRTPHSSMVVIPIASPAPLSTEAPAGTRSLKSAPGSNGAITVTPVRATPRPSGGGGSSRQTVACPTWTCATSTIESVGPGGRRPMRTPRSRGRARGSGGVTGTSRRAARPVARPGELVVASRV